MSDNILRPLGEGKFNVSYEVKVGLPVDARLQVNQKNALLNANTWMTDGACTAYIGMQVFCLEDGNTYRLKKVPEWNDSSYSYTNPTEDDWEIIAVLDQDMNLTNYVTKTGLQEALADYVKASISDETLILSTTNGTNVATLSAGINIDELLAEKADNIPFVLPAVTGTTYGGIVEGTDIKGWSIKEILAQLFSIEEGVLAAGKISVLNLSDNWWDITVSNPNSTDVVATINQTLYPEDDSTSTFNSDKVTISANSSYTFTINLSTSEFYKKCVISVVLSAEGVSDSRPSVETVECPMLEEATIEVDTGGQTLQIINTNATSVTATCSLWYVNSGANANFGSKTIELAAADNESANLHIGQVETKYQQNDYDGVYTKTVLSAPGYRSSTTIYILGDVGDFIPSNS